MSMSHKAFVFGFEPFERELKTVLDQALRSGNVEPLRAFIQAQRYELKDPYEGGPLDEDEGWESLIEVRDDHQYGDFALTKYYQPSLDIGLDENWDGIWEMLEREGLDKTIVLGARVGPADNPFDPGKQGSYFQSTQMALANRSKLEDLIRRRPDLTVRLAAAMTMLKGATDLGKGLYVTF